MSDYVQVTCTIDSEEDAKRLARGIVESRLGACAQILGPIHSVYWWQGDVEEATEWLCLVKTTQDRYKGLESYIKQNHSYDTPEIIATPVAEGSQSYLDWVHAETRAPQLQD